MLEIECSGDPYEIGHKHGQDARAQVSGTIAFYASMFQASAKLEWPKVREVASQFESSIREKWPEYLEEMQGLADGSGTTLLDIIAINVRTEINFGLFSDGCTSLSWLDDRPMNGHTPSSFLAQNWDWQRPQKANLVLMTIRRPNHMIKMVTEAGLIGKIGMNSAGVGICFNALRAKGMDPDRIPCHLGLRLALDSKSREEAVSKLKKYGVAASCYMLIADAETGGVGLEWRHDGCKAIDMNPGQQVFHSNHYLTVSEDEQDYSWIKDSPFRVKRIEHLCKNIEHPDMHNLTAVFKDEDNYPSGICRLQDDVTKAETLFNIIMELKSRTATVLLGRPVAPEETIRISF